MVNLNFGGALLLVLLIDAFLFMGQSASDDVRGGLELPNQRFINFGSQGDLISQKSVNGTLVLDTDQTSMQNDFIDATPTIQAGTTDNFFVDTFTAIKNWFFNTRIVRYTTGVLGGPYNYCVALQLDVDWFCYSIGAVWYILTLFLAIAFATGKQ